MKVLLLNPESPESFWTFGRSIKLVGRRALMPPLGLITMAALLPEHWDLRLRDRSFQPVDDDLWDWAELVMIGGMIVQKDDMISLIREAKDRGKTVVVGGPYVTSVPDEPLAAGADFVVKGEAETTMSTLLTSLKSGASGVVIEEQEKSDLSASPVPRYDLLDIGAYNSMPVQTSRGCPFNCEFCDIVNLFGRVPRYKKPDRVLAELTTLYDLGWSGGVFLCDDNFIGNKKQARELLAELIPWMEAHGTPFGFWVQASVNLGRDPELLDQMTEANFENVFIGIESPDVDVLALNNKHQNVGNPLVESLNNIRARGLSVMGSFIIGFDGEKPGADEQIRSFVEETDLPLVMLNILQVLPNTSLWDRLERENRLLKTRTQGQVTGGLLNYVPSRPGDEIFREYVNLTERLYDPSAIMKRAYDYCRAMPPTRRAQALKRGEAPSERVRPDTRPKGQRILDAHLGPAIRLFWRHGVVAPHRIRFWKNLIGMYIKNPSRVTTYFVALATGENLSLLRETVRERAEANHNGYRQDSIPAVRPLRHAAVRKQM